MLRNDLSSKLIHLTRTVADTTASQRFNQILAESQLTGSSRDVRGGFSVIGFTEAPITMLANVLANAAAQEMRYAPLGVMVDKSWLYELGGRPVIYQSNAEFDDLPECKRYLHVRFEPNNGIDYSWEREWRIQRDALELDPTMTTVIVPTRNWAERYHLIVDNRNSSTALVTHGFATGPRKPRWHFIALEDLGIPIGGLEPIEFEGVT